jgi:hypothetical protein
MGSIILGTFLYLFIGLCVSCGAIMTAVDKRGKSPSLAYLGIALVLVTVLWLPMMIGNWLCSE